MYGVPLVAQTLSADAATWTISGISTSYRHLYVIWTSKSPSSDLGPQALWKYNSSTSLGNIANYLRSGYRGGFVGGDRSNYGPENYIRQASQTWGNIGPQIYTQYKTIIPNYSSSNVNKTIMGEEVGIFGGPYTSPRLFLNVHVNCYNTDNPLTSIEFASNYTGIKAGSHVRIYGLEAL